MDQKLFVLLKIGDKAYKDQVSIDGCSYVSDFKDAIKSKFNPLLNAVAPSQLTLFKPKQDCEIDSGTEAADLMTFGVGPWVPLVVTVEQISPRPTGSTKKQLAYKGLSVESTCRKFFDALAEKLALNYNFRWGPYGENKHPSFGDVLYARDSKTWRHIYRVLPLHERTDDGGLIGVTKSVPRHDVDLPDLFSDDEWEMLRFWNDKTNHRIHDALLPIDNGKAFIAIPRADFNATTINFFKKVGAVGMIVASEDDLLVKNETELSGSEVSGSPDKDMKT